MAGAELPSSLGKMVETETPPVAKSAPGPKTPVSREVKE